MNKWTNSQTLILFISLSHHKTLLTTVIPLKRFRSGNKEINWKDLDQVKNERQPWLRDWLKWVQKYICKTLFHANAIFLLNFGHFRFPSIDRQLKNYSKVPLVIAVVAATTTTTANTTTTMLTTSKTTTTTATTVTAMPTTITAQQGSPLQQQCQQQLATTTTIKSTTTVTTTTATTITTTTTTTTATSTTFITSQHQP